MGFCFWLNLTAQRDTTFFNADWDTVPSSDGAAYYRLFDRLVNDTVRTYYFVDYYITGERQNVMACSDPRCTKKIGEWTWYYKNGQLKQIGSYKNNRYHGVWIEYFDNGDLKSKLEHKMSEDPNVGAYIEYFELYDSKSREHLLANGEGRYVTYYESGDTQLVGQVTQMQKTGNWREYRKNGTLFYNEHYKNGVLQEGVSYDKDGKKYSYTLLEEMPSYVGGQMALMRYLATIQYPRVALEKDIEGTVYVQFVVDKDGNVTKVSIARSSGSTILDEAAMTHVIKSQKWIPGKQRGQKVAVQYVVPIKFKLS